MTLPACSRGVSGDADGGVSGDAAANTDGGRGEDGGGGSGDAGVIDAGNAPPDADAGNADAGSGNADAGTGQPDAGTGQPDAGGGGVITGGPCVSGAAGATAYRIRWADGGGTAYPVYEVNGLPDTSRDHAGAYGYQIGFTPSFVDPYLGDGGLLLNSSDFVDLEISTVGLTQISSATLSLYGRSYNTTTSGSFNWQTFDGTGATANNLVSNAAPYQWYSGDMTGEISPGDDGVLIRIKAGPSSSSLVVNKIELCLQAQ